MTTRLYPLSALAVGTEFTLPAGGDLKGGVLLIAFERGDAKVSVEGKVLYLSTATQVYPRRVTPVSDPHPATARTGQESAMSTKTTTESPKSTKATKATKAARNGKHVVKIGGKRMEHTLVVLRVIAKAKAINSDKAIAAAVVAEKLGDAGFNVAHIVYGALHADPPFLARADAEALGVKQPIYLTKAGLAALEAPKTK